MNSTPSSLARIMRLTAFDPPPPTPITLIFAPSWRSSVNEILMFDSFGVIVLPPVCVRGQRFRAFESLSGKHAFYFCHQCNGPLRHHAASVRPVQQQPYCGCILRLGKFLGHALKAARP